MYFPNISKRYVTSCRLSLTGIEPIKEGVLKAPLMRLQILDLHRHERPQLIPVTLAHPPAGCFPHVQSTFWGSGGAECQAPPAGHMCNEGPDPSL